MAKLKTGSLLYHITALSNLENIFHIGLKPRCNITTFTDTADIEIIEDREANNYTKRIPFHFYAKTPYAWSVINNHQDKDFVYIVIYREYAKSKNFVITPSHPEHNGFSIYEYNTGFNLIDWDSMQTKDYQNNETKQTCLAECLSPENMTIPCTDFVSLWVKDTQTKDKVERMYNKIKGERVLPFHINIRDFCFG